MESCRNIPQLLCAQMDQTLTPQEGEVLEAHLAQCSQCRKLERELGVISQSFDALKELTPPPGFTQRVMDAVAADTASSPKIIPWHRRRGVRMLSGLAACVAICVVAVQMGLPRGQNDLVSGMTMVGGGAVPAAPAPAGESDMMREMAPYTAGSFIAENAEEKVLEGGQLDNGMALQFTLQAQLTLGRLPEGGQALLEPDTTWLADPEGRQYCQVSKQVAEELISLAQEQEIPCQFVDFGLEDGLYTVMIEGE